ncbi:Hansenula MRAKII killer toxin-resistant protein 1 [Pseudosporangium ferrugineum]|uniref:Uncharacterized protein n=1 Tax=Pseudosporangium ferrugineum TaxID=439699 RepID=A0A2T0S189_9ACTN|nr:Hansenula MRAKII killer toxin-resistant protein 1 [Pseudosporangium ferrugineum]PRY27152.1 hypothetical protein CLV70_111117 [Pseudosporangium ferrugineum]
MAAKGWTARVATAAGVAAGTGAAQLGLGYGLGVVVWPAGIADDDSVWLGSLGWATWIAASATVFGAVVAARLGRPLGGPWRFALAASAAVGALLTVALIALPARAAVRADTFSPETVAGGYAVIGVLLGLAIAYWAVVSRPVAANLIATAGWLWALAVAAIVADVFWHRPTATYLSSWQFAAADGGTHGTIHWPSALLTLLAAFVIGVLGAAPSARRGDLGAGAATSGAVGPLLVAAAFFVLAPKLTPALGALGSAYLIAPYAVLAGLAGSAATIALAQQRATRRATRAATPQSDASPSSGPPSGGSPSGGSRSGGSQVSGSQSGGSGVGESVAVPAPRVPRASSSPDTATRAGVVAAEAPAEGESSAGRQRPSLFRRMRRGRDAAAPPVDPSSVATGRAQAPAPARSAPPAPPAPSQGPAPQPSQRQASAPQSPPRQTSAPQSLPRQASAPQSPPRQASAPQPPPRPSSAPQRETVARPPANPAVAKINPVAEGTASGQPKASPVQKTASAQKAAPADRAAPAKAAPAEKTAPGDKPASPQKAAPAKKAAPRKAPARPAQPTKPAGPTDATGTSPSAGAGPQSKTAPPARTSEPPRAGQGKAGQDPA